jgi:hypothetical protein
MEKHTMKVKCVHCSKMFTDELSMNAHRAIEHPDETPTDNDLDSIARQALWQFLNSDGTDRGLLAKAKQANTYRSTEARREQTVGAREATLVMMARELSENKAQFRQLVALALPQSPMLQLTGADRDKSKSS